MGEIYGVRFQPPAELGPDAFLRALIDTAKARGKALESLHPTVSTIIPPEKTLPLEPTVLDGVPVSTPEGIPLIESMALGLQIASIPTSGVLSSGAEVQISKPQAEPHSKLPATREVKKNPKPPPKEIKDPNTLYVNMTEGTLSLGKKSSNIGYVSVGNFLRMLARGSVTLSDILEKDELNTSMAYLTEQALRKIASELEKDPKNPILFTLSGSGSHFSIRCNIPVVIKEKNEQ